ncbi:MAG TPA: SMC-Scp complex subunit ScpB [Lachnospiraceae bacterium]
MDEINLEERIESFDKLEAAVEAILFAVGDAVELSRLAKTLQHDLTTTQKVIDLMKEHYEQENRGLRLIDLEGAVQLCTKKEYYNHLIRMALQPKKAILTEVMLETLSIIAYKQPVTRLEIEKIRGVKSDHAVNKLVEYGLIKEVGRLDVPGRPILFGTTEEFLRDFGVSSTEELPVINPVKLEDFKVEVEEELQMKLEV